MDHGSRITEQELVLLSKNLGYRIVIKRKAGRAILPRPSYHGTTYSNFPHHQGLRKIISWLIIRQYVGSNSPFSTIQNVSYGVRTVIITRIVLHFVLFFTNRYLYYCFLWTFSIPDARASYYYVDTLIYSTYYHPGMYYVRTPNLGLTYYN